MPKHIPPEAGLKFHTLPEQRRVHAPSPQQLTYPMGLLGTDSLLPPKATDYSAPQFLHSHPGLALPRPSLTSRHKTHLSSASAEVTSWKLWSVRTHTGGGAGQVGAWASSHGAMCNRYTCDHTRSEEQCFGLSFFTLTRTNIGHHQAGKLLA